MLTAMFRVATCTVLLTGVLTLPFATDEEANQFLGLKRQRPFSISWHPTSSQNTWGLGTVAEQVSKSWDALKTTTQYYMNLGSYAFDPDTARDHLSSYMDMIRQSGEHLQRQRRKRDATPILELDPDPYCPDNP